MIVENESVECNIDLPRGVSIEKERIENLQSSFRNYFKLQFDPLDLKLASELLKAPESGATCLFEGTTRNTFETKTVKLLEYEAYSNLALKTMHNIATEARQLYKELIHVLIWHRLGKVPVMETSIIVGASSVHRSDSLNAVEWILNKAKERLEVWKYELYNDPNDTGIWKQN